jgi:hypothetical protein
MTRLNLSTASARIYLEDARHLVSVGDSCDTTREQAVLLYAQASKLAHLVAADAADVAVRWFAGRYAACIDATIGQTIDLNLLVTADRQTRAHQLGLPDGWVATEYIALVQLDGPNGESACSSG